MIKANLLRNWDGKSRGLNETSGLPMMQKQLGFLFVNDRLILKIT